MNIFAFLRNLIDASIETETRSRTMDGFSKQTLEGPNGTLLVYSLIPPELKSVLLCAHGGPGGDARGNADIFPSIGRELYKLNVGTVTFDFFGNGGSGGSNADCSLSSQISDFEFMCSEVARKYDKSIIACGESLGATIVRACKISDVLAEVLLWPAFDLTDTDLRDYFTEEWQIKVASEGALIDGDLVIGEKYYNEMRTWDYSNLFNIESPKAMIAHGAADAEVPISQSYKAVEKSAVDIVFSKFQHGEHGLSAPNIRATLTDQILEFIAKL